MSPITTCVLGVGLSGLTFHVPFVLALPELFTLHAVLERNPSSPGGKVKQRFGSAVNDAVKVYKTLDEVLSDDAIELVIVGTPNVTHYEYVKRSLEAGKHVLVDKPAVPTSAEARELGELAKSKNLVLYAYQNRRWDSDFLALKRLLAEPASSAAHLGDLIEFESHYDRYRTVLKGSWREANMPGAGQLYDLGSHLIDQVLSLLGRPEKVTGFVENIRGLGDPDVDDSFTIILRYAPSPERKYPITATLRTSSLSARDPQLRFVVRGFKGTFIKYGLDCQEGQLKAMPDPSGIFGTNFGKEDESIWGELQVIQGEGSVQTTKWPSTEKGAYAELFRNLAGVIRNKEQQVVEWEEVITTLEIIELARESSKKGQTISL